LLQTYGSSVIKFLLHKLINTLWLVLRQPILVYKNNFFSYFRSLATLRLTNGAFSLKIVFIGEASGTSLMRFEAMRRLGHSVELINPYEALPKSSLLRRWSFQTGAFGFGNTVCRYLAACLDSQRFDLAFVDNGELIGPEAIHLIRNHVNRVINYNTDNPFTPRDRGRWRLFLKALPYYDLFVTPRLSGVENALRRGVKQSIRVFMTADEVKNKLRDQPEPNSPYRSEVSFVGTWMPERGGFMARLIDRGVPLRIFGPRWQKAPEFEKIRSHISLGSLNSDQYVEAVAGCDIALCILSKGNEDMHTTRTMEIPAIGRVLCAERTPEHLMLYKEGKEAVFFDTVNECADICLRLLANKPSLKALAKAGSDRVRHDRHFNEPAMARIIDTVFEKK
jgi:spore maturation protein CgeB